MGRLVWGRQLLILFIGKTVEFIKGDMKEKLGRLLNDRLKKSVSTSFKYIGNALSKKNHFLNRK